MKQRLLALLLLSVSPLCLLFALPSLSALAAQPNRPAIAGLAQDNDSYEALKKKFAQAQKLNSKEEMAQLVKSNQQETIWWIIDICTQIAEQSSNQLEDDIADIRAAWKKAFSTQFANNMYEYYSLMSGPNRKQWFETRNRMDLVIDEKWSKIKDDPGYELISPQFESLAVAFEDLGDRYHSARCWQTFAMCHDIALRKDKANLYKAYRGYNKAVQMREELELKDKDHKDCKDRRDVLAKTGYDTPEDDSGEGEEGGGGAGPAVGGPGKPAGAVISAPLTYSSVEKFKEFERPLYNLDEMYSMWPFVFFEEEGFTAPFLAFEGAQLIRESANEVSVDTDKDGKGDVEVPLTGRMEKVEFEFGSGSEKRMFSFFAVIGNDKDRFQNITINLQPSREYLNLYLLPAGMAKATVNDVELIVFDDNMDGIYGSWPLGWNHMGLTTGQSQPDMDSVAIGGSERAQPWSEYTKLGDSWFKLASEKSEIKATPVSPKTGTMQLNFKGGTPSWVVVQGKGDKLENSYFDISGKKPVEMPVGNYKLFYGEIRKGKKLDETKALILPSKKMDSWTVSAGENTKVTLGKPFKFDWEHKVEDTTLKIDGKTVVIVGSAGERYERPWNTRPQPEVSWRRTGSKRASKREDMRMIDSQIHADEVGWEYFWFPLDLELDLKSPQEDGVEVQLFEKKNKLFGKIESDWKE